MDNCRHCCVVYLALHTAKYYRNKYIHLSVHVLSIVLTAYCINALLRINIRAVEKNNAFRSNLKFNDNQYANIHAYYCSTLITPINAYNMHIYLSYILFVSILKEDWKIDEDDTT